MLKRFGVQSKLFLYFGSMILLFIFTFSIINLTLMSNSLRNSAKSNLQQLINITYSYIKTNINNKTINLEQIKKEIEGIKFGESGYFFVIGIDGTALIHPTSQGKNIGNLPHIADIIKNREVDGEKIYVQNTAGAKQGKKKIVLYKYIKEVEWIVIGGPYIDELYKEVYFIIKVIIILALSFVVLTIILILLLARVFTKPISEVNKRLISTAADLEATSKEISSSSDELASGSSELASSIEEITSSLEELQSVVESNTAIVNESETTMKFAYIGVKNVTKEMNELQSALSEIGDNSNKIIKIIKVINDIAFQTNILSLNASVEAARAGEYGRGFAVVADQVKALAQKSADAAKETADLIEFAIDGIKKGITIGDGVLKIQNETNITTEKVSTVLDEINRASKEQLKGINQITQAINQTNSVVQTTAIRSEGASAYAKILSEKYELLNNITNELDILVKGKKKKLIHTSFN